MWNVKIKAIKVKVLFEDDSLLVINKPSGWIVNKARTAKSQPIIQEWIRKNFQFPISNFPRLRSGIVHRLDKETSGVLLVAKTRQAFTNLQQQFKSRKIKKTYIALVHGKIEPKGGIISVPLGRLPWNRKRFGVLPGGRKAETSYRVIKYYKCQESFFSLLKLFPKTGRTHQIRVHLKYLGHPIVGDEFYAGRKTARLDREWCPRLFLHASQISFTHPLTKKQITFKSPLPSRLKAALVFLPDLV